MKALIALVPLVLGSFVLFMLCDFDLFATQNALLYLSPFDWHDIGVVFYCGAIIGWERMLRKKVLGMRTSIFIILGTYVFTAISTQVSAENEVADVTRVMGQIVSGIGFLGAGVMFMKGDKVTGLTSAATIWMLAAIGVCIGVGYLTTAVILSTVGVMLLIIINEIDDTIVNFTGKLSQPFKPVFRIVSATEGYPMLTPHYIIQVKRTRFGMWAKASAEKFAQYSDASMALNSIKSKQCK